MKLISMTDFVLQQDITDIKQRDSIVKYANFLNQPLKLEMFVPCDEDGNVIKLPKACICTDLCSLCKKYQKAQEKVLFEGFDIYSNGDLHNAFVTFESSRLESMNVENLITDFQYSFYLTPNAIKKLNL